MNNYNSVLMERVAGVCFLIRNYYNVVTTPDDASLSKKKKKNI